MKPPSVLEQYILMHTYAKDEDRILLHSPAHTSWLHHLSYICQQTHTQDVARFAITPRSQALPDRAAPPECSPAGQDDRAG